MQYDQAVALKGHILGSLLGANMNSTADQAINISLVAGTKYYIERIIVTAASTSLTTAAGGIYTATSKGGSQIVSPLQVYSSLTTPVLLLLLTLALSTTTRTESILYLSLTTAQGSAATADVHVIGYVL